MRDVLESFFLSESADVLGESLNGFAESSDGFAEAIDGFGEGLDLRRQFQQIVSEYVAAQRVQERRFLLHGVQDVLEGVDWGGHLVSLVVGPLLLSIIQTELLVEAPATQQISR